MHPEAAPVTVQPTYTVTGKGTDIWGTADSFRFVYIPLSGNCTLICRVNTMTNPNTWAKAGLMIRSSLNTGAVNALMAVPPTTTNGVTWQYRSSNNGTTAVQVQTTGITVPRWVKLVRSGNKLTAYQSSNGSTWTQMGPSAVTLSNMGRPCAGGTGGYQRQYHHYQHCHDFQRDDDAAVG